MNPIGNVFCSRCNARLLPTEMQLPTRPKPAEEAPVSVKGISLPTLPTAKDSAFGPEELPDWLLELTEQSLGKVGTAEPSSTEQFPDWLSGLADTAAPQSASETADVFTVLEDAPTLSELPDWLSDLMPEAPAPKRPAPQEVPVSATPDWFAGLLEDEPAGAAELETTAEEAALEELPDWLSELTPGEPAVTPPARAFDIAPPPAAREAAAPPADLAAEPRPELPDWLLATAAPPSGEAPVSQPLPGWLLKNAEEPAPGQASGGLLGAGQLPAWLLKGAEPDAAPPPARPKPVEVQTRQAFAAEVAPEEEETARSLPDWLLGMYDEEEAKSPAAIPAVEPERSAPKARAPVSSAPDWLADIHGATEAGPLSAVFSAGPEEEASGDAGIPDWLAGLAPEAPSAGEGRPASFVANRSIFAGAAPEAAAPAPSATPDGLKGVTAPDEETEFEAGQSAFFPGEAALEAQEADEEPALEAGEMPDWLKGLSPAASSPVERVALFERPAEDESLVRAELPGWLQGLRPPGTGPLPPLPEALAAGAEAPQPPAGGLVRADIPDWVQQLRPAPSAAGEQRALEPAETEGPLTGLRGVLPAGLWVDMPADFQPAPPAAIPESIVAQAQLWQRLLEQPRSIQRPVAQYRARSGRGQLATRLIVAVVLLAVTALGLLWDDAPLAQALSHPHIERFSKAIDALDAGSTVIVAVEYGPAEAGEMTPLAQATLQHLAERNARVMLVSTLPEGPGLIHSLLEPLALANRLPVGRPVYLPGASSGVAQFLSAPADAQLVIVLAGRAERLRWWVEQNNAQATAPKQVIPLNVAVNAATAPLATPYLETAPVAGWLAGLPDAAAYREFRGLSSNVLHSQLDALLLAHWAAAALLLCGLFYYLALGKKGAA